MWSGVFNRTEGQIIKCFTIRQVRVTRPVFYQLLAKNAAILLLHFADFGVRGARILWVGKIAPNWPLAPLRRFLASYPFSATFDDMRFANFRILFVFPQ
jgi:hypothetical protein